MATPSAKEEEGRVQSKVPGVVLTNIASLQSKDKYGMEQSIVSNNLALQSGIQSGTDHYYPEGGFGWCVLAGTFVVGFW